MRTSKCRCGPVELPVLPDCPMTWPCETLDPTDTPIESGAELLIFNWVDYVWKAIVRRCVEENSEHDISFSEYEILVRLSEDAERISRLTESLLTLARMEAVGMHLAAEMGDGHRAALLDLF